MEIIPVVDEGLGNSSYIVDLEEGQGLVVDPERDPGPYLAIAEKRGLRLRWTAETHLHADFVSGGRELSAFGARLMAPREGELRFDHDGLVDGDERDLGGLTLEVIATPGHTPEHCAYLLKDGSTPLALFSGGTLMAGGVARTDLVSPELTEPLARAAYRSITSRLFTLPDDLAVYPTHGAGSFCSSALTGERTTTIGTERRTNLLLQASDEDAFVGLILGNLGTYPTYFGRLRTVNQAGPVVYGSPQPSVRALEPSAVARARDDGAEIVDVRRIERFSLAHLPGSVSIELRPALASWLGWVVDPDADLIFVADPDQDLSEAVRQSLNIGYENLSGYLVGGVEAWIAEDRPVATIPIVAPSDVTPGAGIVDVRQGSEWVAGVVPGAELVELGSVAGHAFEPGPERVVHCVHGARAMTGASLMQKDGVKDIAITGADAGELAAALPSAR